MHPKPVILLIFDGWGQSEIGLNNAIANAHTPNWDKLMKTAPHTLISASGLDVGLPEYQMGNSEVGHLTMGAGRVIYQDLTRISKAIENKSFFQNEVLLNAFERAKDTQHAIHILGLLSPGGVHSHEDHIFACIEMAAGYKQPVYVHAFLDGRDTPPKSAKSSIEKCQKVCDQFANVKIATICGRYYAMDRDKRWERTQEAYEAICHAKAPFYADNALDALQMAYDRGETDEFVKPTCILEGQNKISLNPNDIVVYMNFRSDRARALTMVFTQVDFNEFDRGQFEPIGDFITLTQYDETLNLKVAFAPEKLENTLGEFLQNKQLTQLRLAETEKYAHVTFFFNGGKEPPYKGEQRILVPSPKIATYDLKPQMSAFEVTKILVSAIEQKQVDFIVCNFANADMVGHTGNYEATLKAIETLDECLLHIVHAIKKMGAQALITADHGNAECMFDNQSQQAHTAHTTSLVPLVYVGPLDAEFKPIQGTLADIAPTILDLMGLDKPSQMTGHTLITLK